MAPKFFKKKPEKGKPISTIGLANGLAAMAYALEHMKVENGRIDWSMFGAPTIVWGDDAAGNTPALQRTLETAGGDSTPRSWGIEIDGTTATISDCLYMRGPVSNHTASVAVADFDAVGDTVYLYARISTLTGTVEVLAANSIANATDATIPTSDDYFKKLLYKLERDDGASPFAVTMDYRNALEMVSYV